MRQSSPLALLLATLFLLSSIAVSLVICPPAMWFGAASPATVAAAERAALESNLRAVVESRADEIVAAKDGQWHAVDDLVPPDMRETRGEAGDYRASAKVRWNGEAWEVVATVR